MSTIPFWNFPSSQNPRVFQNSFGKSNLTWIHLAAKPHLNRDAADFGPCVPLGVSTHGFHHRNPQHSITGHSPRLHCVHRWVYGVSTWLSFSNQIFWILKRNWPLGPVSIWNLGSIAYLSYYLAMWLAIGWTDPRVALRFMSPALCRPHISVGRTLWLASK